MTSPVHGVTLPAVGFHAWALPAQELAIRPSNLLHMLGPVSEPLNAGAPPKAPDFVGAMTVPYPIRAVWSRSGHRTTSPADVAGTARPRWRVKWTGLTGEERAELRSWAREDVNGTLRGWELEVDGEGTRTTVVVRFVSDPAEVFRAAAGGPVFDVAEAEVEQLIQSR